MVLLVKGTPVAASELLGHEEVQVGPREGCEFFVRRRNAREIDCIWI